MFPRHHALLSATMLALAATMSKKDSPVVPSPEPDDEGSSYDKAHSYLGDDLDYLWQKGKQESAPVLSGKHSALRRNPLWTDPDPTTPKWVRCEQRPQQRASKKARAKRKAKKGWA